MSSPARRSRFIRYFEQWRRGAVLATAKQAYQAGIFFVACQQNPPEFILYLQDHVGPPNQDLSLIRNRRIGERYNGQFRARYFNMLNRPNFWMPNTEPGSGQTVRIQQTVTLPRVGQYAVKLTFQ